MEPNEAMIVQHPVSVEPPSAEAASESRKAPPIRYMISRDMAEVLDIERRSFEFPWTEDDFVRCLRQRNCIGMVYEFDGRVLASMIYELCETRLHLLSLAVHPEERGNGIGRKMVEKLVGKLGGRGHKERQSLICEVRERNLPAHKFFASLGFRAVGVLRNFYEDSDEDAYLFRYRLGEGK